MAYIKTQWVNGETPINESNLNNIENGIETLQPEIITVGTSETKNLGSGETTYNFGVDDILGQVGSGFTLANTTGQTVNPTGIKIPAGVSVVEINSNQQFTNKNTTSSMYFAGFVYLEKAESGESSLIGRAVTPTIVAGGTGSATITPILAEVEENDIIYLRAFKEMSNGTATIDIAPRTYITIKKIC